MSGIAGIIRFDGGPVEPGLVERMTGAMAHRGPNGIHHWVKGSVAMGQCMVRITQESMKEQLPLTNEDESLVLVMDGRLDNWVELRRDLLAWDVVLRSRSDAELVLRAYEVWGRDCPARLEGDFAFVIWNGRKREAFCARDRMGHKPLCFWRSEGAFAFASEPGAVLGLPFMESRINLGVVAEFLTQEFLSHTETCWAGVERLPQATWLRVGPGFEETKVYWSPEAVGELVFNGAGEYVGHYRDLFLDQVRRCASSHLPVGVEVSGGLDSSAVFAGCVHLDREGSLPAPGFQGFTFDMSDDPGFDDTRYVEAVERFLDADIDRVAPFVDTPDGYQARAARTGSFPGYPNGVMHMSIHEAARSAGCAAVLTGLGGDEWLGGTRSSLLRRLLPNRLGAAARSIRGAVQKILGKRHPTDDERLELSRSLASIHEARKRETRSSADEMSPRNSDRETMLGYYKDPFRAIAAEQSDLMASLSNVEVRHPLDSARILEFAVACPAKLRRHRGVDRPLHREAMRGLLPPEVLGRTTKATFDRVFRRSAELLNGNPPPLNLVREWLDIRHADLVRNWPGEGRPGELSWMDWSMWSLFACSAVLKGVDNRYHTNGRA